MIIIAAFEVKRSRAGLDQLAQSRRDLRFIDFGNYEVLRSAERNVVRPAHLTMHRAPLERQSGCREVYKHLTLPEPEHRFGSRLAAATSVVHSPTNSYCQRASAGIYSVPSLAPLTNKVSQVEMEAGDCEGRLPPLFFAGSQRPEARGQMSDVRYQMLEWWRIWRCTDL